MLRQATLSKGSYACTVISASVSGPAFAATICGHRRFGTHADHFTDCIQRPSLRHQIYISNSSDPFVNLSIEHRILQSSHKDSTVLFLYVNRPCVVIGRNQNPWLETNLRLLSNPKKLDHASTGSGSSDDGNLVDLVRRRSGGGAVFHDYGNVNYSITCPPKDFTRDRYAEMVVRALRLDSARARVNERHDIVLDLGDELPDSLQPHELDYHRSPYDPTKFRKVSGSAYKLTRTRSLHHGTCLVNSPNIRTLGKYLRSPAEPFIKARGVDSVRSPVTNVYSVEDSSAVEHFQQNVVKFFSKLHSINNIEDKRLWNQKETSFIDEDGQVAFGRLGEDIAAHDTIAKGVEEMKSIDWTFCGTPQFTLSSYATEEDPRPRPNLPPNLPRASRIHIKVRHGVIEEASISTSANSTTASQEALAIDAILKGRKIHEIDSWFGLFEATSVASEVEGLEQVALWLDNMFGKKQ